MNALLLALTLSMPGQAKPPVFEWHPTIDSPGQMSLRQDGKQVGIWVESEGKYYPLVDGKWLSEQEPPIPPPTPKGSKNFGCDFDKIRPNQWTYNGRGSTRKEVMDALEKSLPDDTTFLRVTVIGSVEARKPVLSDLESHASLIRWKGKLIVQDYSPGDWAVAGIGFKTDGNPTIYVQSSDGKVLHRQDTYDGPDKLAEALRKCDPNYKPDKDPNVTLPFSLPTDWKTYVPYALAALAGYLLLRKQK